MALKALLILYEDDKIVCKDCGMKIELKDWSKCVACLIENHACPGYSISQDIKFCPPHQRKFDKDNTFPWPKVK